MKRRKALKQLGLGLTAGVVMPSWLSACQKDSDPKPEINYSGKIVVIGAGAAGLYTADILRAKGINVTVLEASNKIGGRIRSLRPFDKPGEALWFGSESKPGSDFPLELGAEKIIGTEALWANFVKKQKINNYPLNTHNTDYYFLDSQLAQTSQATSDNDFAAAKIFLDNIKNYAGANVSVSDAIQAEGLNARVHQILNAWIGNKYGTSNNRLSMLALAQGLALKAEDNNELLLSNNPMVDVLIASFNRVATQAQLNTVVKSINHQGEKVILSGEKIGNSGSQPFTLEADKVIVTVPVSVLKGGDITFTPALPAEKITSLSRMAMDASLRIILDFKQNFWGEDVRYIYGGSVSPEYFNAGVGRSALTRTMSLTVNGVKAEELSAMNGPEIIQAVLSELDTVYQGKASAHIRKDAHNNFIAIVHNWGKEPFIKGSSAYIKAGGGNTDRITLGLPVSNRIFFAGEATDASGEFATVNGALRSAERVADEVIDSI